MKKQPITALALTFALLCVLVLPVGAANLSPKLTYTLSGNTAALTLENLGGESIYGVQLELKLAGRHASAAFTPADKTAYAPPCHYTVSDDTTLVTVYLTSQGPLNRSDRLTLGTLTLPGSFTMPATATVILLGHDLQPVADGLAIPAARQSSSSGGSSGGGGSSGNKGNGGSGGSGSDGTDAAPSTDETPTGPLPFTDVSADAWYFDVVDYAYRQGLMNGTSTTTFSPEDTTSRAMVVTILHRLTGTPAAPAPDFPDVGPDTYYTAAVGWATQFGVVMGYDTGLFLPDGPITREQMAVILYRYARRMDYDVTAQGDLSFFTDSAAVSDWALDAMTWAVGAGLLNGMGDGTVVPRGHTTRAQAAAILTRFSQKVAR